MAGVMRSAALAAVVCVTAWSGTAAAVDQAMIDAAKKEGEVVWYSTLIVNQAVRPLSEAFEKKYGIPVKGSRATSAETALKIINEARAGQPRSDVFDGSVTAFPLLEAGQVEKYKPEAAKDFPAEVKDPDGAWTATHLYFMTASYNKELVKEKDVPKTYADLLDPKWKGKMAWTNDMTPNGPPGFIHNILTIMGQDKGMDYLRKLSKQNVVTIAASQRVVLDRVIEGEYPLGLMTFNHHDAISAAKGAPVDWIKMEPLIATMSVVGLVKGAPHPSAGKLFIEFILSDEGQKVLQEAFYLPAKPGVPAKDPALKPDKGDFKVTYISPAVGGGDDLGKWTAIYNELFK